MGQAEAKPRGGAPGRRPGSVSPARQAAFTILLRVETSAAHSDDLLHGPAMAGIAPVDRDLATALVMGVLRWQIALDARLVPLLSRPDLQVKAEIRVALRMGAFQLLYMERIPAHAALHESVELVRGAGQPQAAGMVNAVLRRLTQEPAPRRPLVESLEAMAERLAHPLWLVEGWAAEYGRAAAEAICGFDQKEPRCSEIFPEAEPGGPALPVMDSGSRLVAELAASARPDAKRIWDCCAAPGGKATVLARRCPAAELLATDNSPFRLKRLSERLRREGLGETVRTELADASALPPMFGSFDLILCDVPCSGTGTLARNPEIRHRLEPGDLQRQTERQTAILRGALGRLAPGGVLVYATCSLESEENDAVVEAVAGRQDRIGRVDAATLLREMETAGRLRLGPGRAAGLVRGGNLRTLPGAGFEGDGFFAAVLRRS